MKTNKEFRKAYFPPTIEEVTSTCESLIAESGWTEPRIPDDFIDLYEL